MTRPPVLAEGLVRIVCPARYARLALCDLQEEFCCRSSRDQQEARRWYWRHAIRSLWPLVSTELRHWNWQLPLLTLLAGCAGPAVLLNAWWRFLLSQIPLKASEVRGVDFAAIELGATFLFSMAAGAGCTWRGLLLAVPAAWGFLWLGQTAAGAVTPLWFGPAGLGCVTVALIAGAAVGNRRGMPVA
jgi:hypothetical protein